MKLRRRSHWRPILGSYVFRLSRSVVFISFYNDTPQRDRGPIYFSLILPAHRIPLTYDHCPLQDFAQKALVAYLRSVFLQPRKDVFNVAALPVEDFAASLGLASVPRLRFLRRVRGRQEVVEVAGREALQEMAEAVTDSDGEEEEGVGGRGAEAVEGAGPHSKKRRRNDGEAAGDGRLARQAGTGGGGEEQQDDEDFLVVKKRDVFSVPMEPPSAGDAGRHCASEKLGTQQLRESDKNTVK